MHSITTQSYHITHKQNFTIHIKLDHSYYHEAHPPALKILVTWLPAHTKAMIFRNLQRKNIIHPRNQITTLKRLKIETNVNE